MATSYWHVWGDPYTSGTCTRMPRKCVIDTSERVPPYTSGTCTPPAHRASLLVSPRLASPTDRTTSPLSGRVSIPEQRYGGCSTHEKVEKENPRTIGKLIDEDMKESSKLRPARKGQILVLMSAPAKAHQVRIRARDGAGRNRYVHVGADRDRVWRGSVKPGGPKPLPDLIGPSDNDRDPTPNSPLPCIDCTQPNRTGRPSPPYGISGVAWPSPPPLAATAFSDSVEGDRFFFVGLHLSDQLLQGGPPMDARYRSTVFKAKASHL